MSSLQIRGLLSGVWGPVAFGAQCFGGFGSVTSWFGGFRFCTQNLRAQPVTLYMNASGFVGRPGGVDPCAGDPCGEQLTQRYTEGRALNPKPQSPNPKPRNPKPLNPQTSKPCTPKPRNPKPLNPKPLNPKPLYTLNRFMLSTQGRNFEASGLMIPGPPKNPLKESLIIVEARKLELSFRRISARIPYALP